MNRRAKFTHFLMIGSLIAPFLLNAVLNDKTECGYIFDRYSTDSIPSVPHWFTELIPANGTSVDSAKLEDGSIWKFNPYDAPKALNWIAKEGDEETSIQLIITQNFSWYSNYRYRIINISNGESIEANLLQSPMKANPHARFIVSIDQNSRTILLDDNTRFEVSQGDSALLRNWTLFDYVIKGQNGGWSSSYESLLINFDKECFVHTKQVY